MQDKLRGIEQRYAELEARLSAPETYNDPQLVAKLNREQKELAPLVDAWRRYEQRQRDLADAQEMMGDPDMKELARRNFRRPRPRSRLGKRN